MEKKAGEYFFSKSFQIYKKFQFSMKAYVTGKFLKAFRPRRSPLKRYDK